MNTLADTMVSPWIAIPIAAVGMVMIAGYTLGIQRDDVPPARRRLRTASGVLHIFIIALIAYGTSIAQATGATADQKKLFVLTWMLVVGLVALAIALALADVIVNVRIHVRERRRYAKESAEKLARELLEVRAGSQGRGS